MSVIKLTLENFAQEVLKSDKPVLVDFYADWCGPCRMLIPVLEESEGKIGIPIKKVNVDESSNIAREYGVMTIPTLILFENGKEVKRNVGFINAQELEEFVK